MYETPPCPSCFLVNIVCKTCKANKPPMPSGHWCGHWWYCSAACVPKEPEPGEMCRTHREALEKLRQSHPHLFRR
jgi:hypothetical protein